MDRTLGTNQKALDGQSCCRVLVQTVRTSRTDTLSVDRVQRSRPRRLEIGQILPLVVASDKFGNNAARQSLRETVAQSSYPDEPSAQHGLLARRHLNSDKLCWLDESNRCFFFHRSSVHLTSFPLLPRGELVACLSIGVNLRDPWAVP